MHLGSIYLIVNDFNKSIKFYEKLLQIPVTRKNMDYLYIVIYVTILNQIYK